MLRLPPVLHQPDLPLAGNLLSVLWRRTLHDARGGGRHHDALSQAWVGRAQPVGRDVSSGSWGGQRGRSGFDYQDLTLAKFHSFGDFLFEIRTNRRTFNNGCLIVTSLALLPFWEGRFPAEGELESKLCFEQNKFIESVFSLNKEPKLLINCVKWKSVFGLQYLYIYIYSNNNKILS